MASKPAKGTSSGILSFFKRELPAPPLPPSVSSDKALRKQREQVHSEMQDLNKKAAALTKKEHELADLEVTLKQKQKAFSNKDSLIKETMSSVNRSEKHKLNVAKEVDELEAQRNALEDKIAVLRGDLKALQEDVIDNRTELGSSERTIAKKYQEMRSLQHRVEAREKLLDSKEDVLANKDAGLTSLHNQLQKRSKELEAQEKKLTAMAESQRHTSADLEQKRAATLAELAEIKLQIKEGLSTREKNAQQRLLQFEAQAAKRKSDLNTEIATLHQQIKMLEKTHDELVSKKETELRQRLTQLRNDVKVADRELEERRSLTIKATREIDSRMRKIDETQRALNQQKALLDKKEKVLAEKESGLISLDKQLEIHKQEFADRDRELIRSELKLSDQRRVLDDSREELEGLKDSLTEELEGRKAEYQEYLSQWKAERDAVNKARAEVTREKKSIGKLVEGDVSVLSEKEDEISKSIKEFERDKKRLRAEEDKVVDRVRELERVAHQHNKIEQQFRERETALKQFEQSLEKKEALLTNALKKAAEIRKKTQAAQDKILRVKEVKADIKRLEALRSELDWTVERESRKVISLGGKLKSTQSKINEFKVFKDPEPVKPARKAIPHRFTPAEPEMEEHIYEPPQRREGHEEGTPAARPSEIPHLLNQAHDAIAMKDVDRAKQVLAKLQHVHSQLRDGESKRTLGYEILDLRTSLKLALIS